MTIGTLLRGALTADSEVSALVGSRVYPLHLPQKPMYEAITYQRISNGPQNGSTALRDSRWQISGWAETYQEAHVLAVAVKTALEEYKNVSATPGIKQAYVVNELDDYDDEAKVYRIIVDVILVTTGD